MDLLKVFALGLSLLCFSCSQSKQKTEKLENYTSKKDTFEEVKESDYVVILDPPEVPLHRSKPNKRLLVILAGFSGLGLGIMLAFIREFAANSEKEEKDKMSEAVALVSKNISELISRKSK